MKDMGKSSQEEVATTGTGSLFPQELLSTILPWGFLSALGLPWPFPISAFYQAWLRQTIVVP